MIHRPQLAVLLSFCVTGSVSYQSEAAFVNVTIENENAFFANHPSLNVRNAWNALEGSLDVYRVYANFDSQTPQDHVFRVFGSPVQPSFLASTNNSFFNVVTINPKTNLPQHYDSPISPSFYGTSPALAWGTFATIGFGPFNWTTGFFGSQSGAVLDHLQSSWVNTSVEWRHAVSQPEEGDAVPGGPSGFRVGLFQATVAAGTQVSGQFALDTGHGLIWGDNTTFTTIPAPGGLALLLILTLAARRRRHA